VRSVESGGHPRRIGRVTLEATQEGRRPPGERRCRRCSVDVTRRGVHLVPSSRRDVQRVASMPVIVASEPADSRPMRATRPQRWPGRAIPLLLASGGFPFRRRARCRAASARASRRCALQVRCLPHEQSGGQWACCSCCAGVAAPRRSVMAVVSFGTRWLQRVDAACDQSSAADRRLQGCRCEVMTELAAPNLARLMPVSLRVILLIHEASTPFL
jgi:hypothetical protein